MFQVGDFSFRDESLQFGYTVAGDVFVHVVVALRTQALQHHVAVETCQAAKAVAVERGVAVRLFVLHHVFHHLKAVKVGFVEVLCFGLRNLYIRRALVHLAERGVLYGLHRGAQRAEEEKHVYQREEENVYREQYEVEKHGDDHKEKRRHAESCSVEDDVARKFHALYQFVGKSEDVGNVVARKQQSYHSQHDVARKEIFHDVVAAVDVCQVAPCGSTYAIYEDEHERRRGIPPHSSPLQVARHAKSERIDAEQVGAYKKIDEKHGVENAKSWNRVVGGHEEESAAIEQAHQQHNPRLREELHTAACEVKHHQAHHEMGCGGKFNCY